MPSGHVYVRHLADPDGGDGIDRLPDIEPADGRKVPGGWWPPVMLDAGWIRENRDRFDLFHVHFGFDAKTPTELEEVTTALGEVGAPLAVTVHDLRNPHHHEGERHDAQLRVLLDDAAAVLTLTPGAASEIERRYGCENVRVLPHPHVLEFDELGRARRRHDDFVIGLHAKSLRANMDAVGVARALCEAASELPGVRVQIDVHEEIFDPDNHWFAPASGAELLDIADGYEAAELRVHPYFSDSELWDYLRGIDASVLPYRFGTHSGWLEACYDLGTLVIAPTCGFYVEQRPCLTYRHDESGLDVDSLREAVRVAALERPRFQADRDGRLAERRALAASHRSLYRALLGAPSAPAGSLRRSAQG
ncbi:glycosyltransferase family 1 protein [Thermoleophilia bacterium SCSIO 60948]|nr:glycosyltransferase family 1 protein [Thermoleophilia bacterium SCSIO 60948]